MKKVSQKIFEYKILFFIRNEKPEKLFVSIPSKIKFIYAYAALV
jgi:hypothetical protein